jgi:hypothetical protein
MDQLEKIFQALDYSSRLPMLNERLNILDEKQDQCLFHLFIF